MSAKNETSTGHEASGVDWLDLHLESSRAEYESALREVGIGPGWSVLDAGCGSGSFLPLICDSTGPEGTVAALDLAPENVRRAEGMMSKADSGPLFSADTGLSAAVHRGRNAPATQTCLVSM